MGHWQWPMTHVTHPKMVTHLTHDSWPISISVQAPTCRVLPCTPLGYFGPTSPVFGGMAQGSAVQSGVPQIPCAYLRTLRYTLVYAAVSLAHAKPSRLSFYSNIVVSTKTQTLKNNRTRPREYFTQKSPRVGHARSYYKQRWKWVNGLWVKWVTIFGLVTWVVGHCQWPIDQWW